MILGSSFLWITPPAVLPLVTHYNSTPSPPTTCAPKELRVCVFRDGRTRPERGRVRASRVPGRRRPLGASGPADRDRVALGRPPGASRARLPATDCARSDSELHGRLGSRLADWHLLLWLAAQRPAQPAGGLPYDCSIKWAVVGGADGGPPRRAACEHRGGCEASCELSTNCEQDYRRQDPRRPKIRESCR